MDNMQFSNPFSGTPKLSKIVACVLTVFLVLDLLFPSLSYVFALNVAKTIPFIWNIFTSGFYEIYFITGAVNIALLMIAGKFLEPIWGSKEFLKFIIVVNLGAGIGAFFLMLILYAIVKDPYLLYDSNLCGFSGVITGFSVAMKQLLPEQDMTLFFALTVRMKHMPGIIVLGSIALFVLRLFPSHHLPHVLFGVVAAWFYLRFYQKKGDVVGDLTDEFAFSTFFPEPVRPVINIISTILYKLTYVPLRFVGAVPQRTRPTQSVESPYSDLLSTAVVSTNTADVERRRMLAAKAVDARLLQPGARRQEPPLTSPPSPPSPPVSPPSSPPPSPFPTPSAPSLTSSTEIAQSQ
eukprot:Phypoly_transcript_11086.p1 GENE.Phypoly_transcript_11086~~Phypoly_transcript_11086.p1  ORF type:complete len:350 (+),score=64.47 Phypoly_transcript_11086:88-1137(+)